MENPTAQSKVAFIRDACIEANPSIKDLVFGCRILWLRSESEERKEKLLECLVVGNLGNGVIDIIDIHRINFTRGSYTVFIDGSIKNTLGREIRFADVLLAIEKRMGKALHLDLNGVYIVEFEKGTKFWDLIHDSLLMQSPEAVDFIYNLLK